MKKKFVLIPVVLAAAISLAGCDSAPRHTGYQAVSHHRHLHHFSDGRVGYVDNSGIWWYLAATHMGGSSTSTADLYSSATTWTQGSAPSKTELQNSQQEEIEVNNTADQTLDQPESVEAESAEDAGAASVPDMGEPEEAADDNVEPADSGTTNDDSAVSTSDSVGDSGSSDGGSSGGDSGGGGDGGGGE